MLTTFLPWHTRPIFYTLLEILPRKLPIVYHFLTPYAKSQTNVPILLLVNQAARNRDFLTMLSDYTIRSCESNQGYRGLIMLWGQIVTQSLALRIQQARSGRQGVLAATSQEILTLYAPLIGRAIVTKVSPELQRCAYSVAVIYASSGNLEDATLAAFMEQVVVGWPKTPVPMGIECLAALAQQRSQKPLPKRVVKAILKAPSVTQSLAQCAERTRIDRLVYTLSISLIERLTKRGEAFGLAIIQSIFHPSILKPDRDGLKQASAIFKLLLNAANSMNDQVDPAGDARSQLGVTLRALSQITGEIGDALQETLRASEFDLDNLEMTLNVTIRRPKSTIPALENNGSEKNERLNEFQKPTIDVLLSQAEKRFESLKGKKNYATALIECSQAKCAHDKDCIQSIVNTLDEIFLAVITQADDIKRHTFEQLSPLQNSAAFEVPFYFSFFVRIWMGNYPVLARTAALNQVVTRMKQAKSDMCYSFSMLLPYCIAALGDPAKRVRRAAADLMAAIKVLTKSTTSDCLMWGRYLYRKNSNVTELPKKYENAIIERIVGSLEECVIDTEHISTIVSSCLKDKEAMGLGGRTNFLEFLAAHALESPLFALRYRLVRIVESVGKVGSTSKTEHFLEILRGWMKLGSAAASQTAREAGIDESSIDCVFAGIITSGECSGIDAALAFFGPDANFGNSGEREGLVSVLFARMVEIWPSMKSEVKLHVARNLLGLCFSDDMIPSIVIGEAMQLLKSVKLSSRILADFLEKLDSPPKAGPEDIPRKRRRMSSSETNPQKRRRLSSSTPGSGSKPLPELDSQTHDMVAKTTFVLELVDGSEPAEHPALFDVLFGTLTELHHYKSFVGSELGYLQNLILKSLLAMIPACDFKQSNATIDSFGHGDVLMRCIKDSSSPSVQNSALLLVSALATHAPHLVLHSIVSIFSCVGSSVLRQSDDFSAHVVSQTIKSVVPPMLRWLRKERRNALQGTLEFLGNFVDEYQHIPLHRRWAIFNSLIFNLGPDEYAYVVIAMLVDRYGATDEVISFVIEIIGSYDIDIQLHTFVQLLDLAQDIFKTSPTISTTFFRGDDMQDRQPTEIAVSQLGLLPRLLGGRRISSQVREALEDDDMTASKVRDLYSIILERILLLADTVKSNKQLHIYCGDALSNHLNLLSIGDFIKAVESLLDRPNAILRHRVLRALEVRVDQEGRADPKSCEALLAFMPTLTAAIRDSDDINYKHTAVACVDKISEKYGKKDIEAVTAAAAIIASNSCLGQEDGRLRNMALLCLASLVDILQDAIVPTIPAALPKTLQYIEQSLQPNLDPTLHNAGYHFVTSLSQNVSFMMTGKYLEKVLATSILSAARSKDLGNECNETRKECLELLARQVDAKAMFTAMQNVWELAASSEFEVSFFPFHMFLSAF